MGGREGERERSWGTGRQREGKKSAQQESHEMFLHSKAPLSKPARGIVTRLNPFGGVESRHKLYWAELAQTNRAGRAAGGVSPGAGLHTVGAGGREGQQDLGRGVML